MLRMKDITSTLLNVVGWSQEGYAGVDIDTALTKSETGLYFQQAHALVNLKTLQAIAPDFQGLEAEAKKTAFSAWL